MCINNQIRLAHRTTEHHQPIICLKPAQACNQNYPKMSIQLHPFWSLAQHPTTENYWPKKEDDRVVPIPQRTQHPHRRPSRNENGPHPQIAHNPELHNHPSRSHKPRRRTFITCSSQHTIQTNGHPATTARPAHGTSSYPNYRSKWTDQYHKHLHTASKLLQHRLRTIAKQPTSTGRYSHPRWLQRPRRSLVLPAFGCTWKPHCRSNQRLDLCLPKWRHPHSTTGRWTAHITWHTDFLRLKCSRLPNGTQSPH